MKGVMVVPTGVGAEIGGHAGDATPAARLIASCCEWLIIHPNVVNASDINEMSENMLYVEGSMLDRFLAGEIGLDRVRANRVLVAVNAPAPTNVINAVSAARATLGVEARIVELRKPLKMVARLDAGLATGQVFGHEALIEQICDLAFDALAIVTPIDCDRDQAVDYLRRGGVNPWGGVEAVTSRLISMAIGCPVAHAPLDAGAFDGLLEVCDPRMAAEFVSVAYMHCIMKGLHRAPQVGCEIMVDQLDFLVSADGCYGRPHQLADKQGVKLLIVRENATAASSPMPDSVILVENYLEAAGALMAWRAGTSLDSVRRPLAATEILREAR